MHYMSEEKNNEPALARIHGSAQASQMHVSYATTCIFHTPLAQNCLVFATSAHFRTLSKQQILAEVKIPLISLPR